MACKESRRDFLRRLRLREGLCGFFILIAVLSQLEMEIMGAKLPYRCVRRLAMSINQFLFPIQITDASRLPDSPLSKKLDPFLPNSPLVDCLTDICGTDGREP